MKVESVSRSYMAISLAPSLIGFLASKKTAVSTKAQQMPSQFHLKTQVVEQEGGAFQNLKGIGEGVPLRSSKQNMSTKNQSDICSLPSLPSRDIYIYMYIYTHVEVHIPTGSVKFQVSYPSYFWGHIN